MRTRRLWIPAIAVGLTLTAMPWVTHAARAAAAAPVCDPGLSAGQLTGTGAVARTALTRSTLVSDPSPGLVPNDAFALPAAAAPPTHAFNGTLALQGTATNGDFQLLKDTSSYLYKPGVKYLPPVKVSFVQDCSYLIPTVRGLQITGSRAWNLIVSPGRVWNEADDGGWTRASFPFTLVERNANCTHNGVMTFLFNDSSISQVRYEIAKETCEYFQFDMWGQLSALASRSVPADAVSVRAAYAQELADQVPSKPIADLATDYPGSGIDVSVLPQGVTLSAMTTYGLYFHGVDYVANCVTREGDYPYCPEMILPSYSVAKSMFASLALMELSQQYGHALLTDKVQSYLPITAVSLGDWSGVTFQNLTDMATGNYDSSAFESDEDGEIMTLFLALQPFLPKLLLALTWLHQSPPGTVWVYHTSDTFLLTLAERRFLDARSGTSADIWEHLVQTVLAPLHVGPDSLIVERTNDSQVGVPMGGLGMFLTQDAVAKIAGLMNNTGGQINGRQVLDPGMLASAMQRTPGGSGLETDPPNRGGLYHDNLWASRFGPGGRSGYSCSFYVPYMSGYGGITVAMMPNGATFYEFGDNAEFAWAPSVAQANKLAPQCGA